MSNLLVQNIKHTNNTTSMAIDTSGQVSVRGEGSATTTNLQQGLCKCWVQFDGSASGAAAEDSFNLTGMTDVGTGDYTITIANNMNNAGYSVPCAGDDRNHNHVTHTIATGSFGFRGRVGIEGSTANNADTPEASCAVFGDLA
jgi:hypothetical protein